MGKSKRLSFMRLLKVGRKTSKNPRKISKNPKKTSKKLRKKNKNKSNLKNKQNGGFKTQIISRPNSNNKFNNELLSLYSEFINKNDTLYRKSMFYYDEKVECPPPPSSDPCNLRYKDLTINILCESKCGGTTNLILKLEYKGKKYVVKIMDYITESEYKIMEELMNHKIDGIVEYYGTIKKETTKQENQYHLIMEYGDKLPNPLTLDHLSQLKNIIENLHSKKITHNDITIDNLIIVESKLKLIDFGNAVLKAEDFSLDTKLLNNNFQIIL